MRTLSKICFTAVFVTAIVAASVRTAQAAIIVEIGVDNAGVDNVLLTTVSNVAIVTGTVSGEIVKFESDSGTGAGLLSADASGQAVITGGTGNNPFTDIFFYLDGDRTFTKADFNINVVDAGHVTGLMDIVINYISGVTGLTTTSTVTVNWNGQNFFNVEATNGDEITQIRLDAQGAVLFEDLRQVRLGGFGDGEDVPDVTAVPEPTSMFLLGTGLFGLAAKVRSRRKK